MNAAIAGLDLSATAAAIVSAPLRWDNNWSRVRSVVAGEGLRRDATDEERARRCESIARTLLRFCDDNNVGQVWIEGYAFNQRTSAHTLGEVGGVVRLELVRAGIAIRTANMSTARKLLLGKLPRKGAKVAAYEALRAAGCPAWTLDESDAFVCANLGLSEHAGAFCFATQPPVVEKKVRVRK